MKVPDALSANLALVPGVVEMCKELVQLNRAASVMTQEQELFVHTRNQTAHILHKFITSFAETAADQAQADALTYQGVQSVYEVLLATDGGDEVVNAQSVFLQHLRAAWRKVRGEGPGSSGRGSRVQRG